MTEAIRARARLQDWWDHLWFQSVPPDLFALLRMVFGLLGLAAILELTPVSMYWAVDGIAPVPGGGMGLRQLLLQRGLSDAVSWFYFLGLSAAFACMTVGFRTRAAVFASWLGTSLLSPWNHLPLTSAILTIFPLFERPLAGITTKSLRKWSRPEQGILSPEQAGSGNTSTQQPKLAKSRR